jgi:DNA-binding MarR family transcriptional regulator
MSVTVDAVFVLTYGISMNATIAPVQPPAPAGRAAQGDQAARAALTEAIIADSDAIAARRRCAVARGLHDRGISMTHLHVLWTLREQGALPVTRLADFLGVAVPNATGLVDRMEQRGLVERDRDPADRRLVIVRPTPGGIAAAAEIDGWRADLLLRVLDRLDTEQLELIASVVHGIRAAAAEGAAPGRVDPVAEPDPRR